MNPKSANQPSPQPHPAPELLLNPNQKRKTTSSSTHSNASGHCWQVSGSGSESSCGLDLQVIFINKQYRLYHIGCAIRVLIHARNAELNDPHDGK